MKCTNVSYFVKIVFVILSGVYGCISFAASHTIMPELATGSEHKPTVYKHHDMVVTNNVWASRGAIEVLHEGGNAVDAAIVAGFILGLTEPQSSGIGGGGYTLSYDNEYQQMMAYDGREVAPKSATPNLFLDESGMPIDFMQAMYSPKSVGVPGEVALFYDMHNRQGKLPWKKLLDPAIRLAKNGFPMSPRLYTLLVAEQELLRQNPEIRVVYFMPDGQVKPVGSKVVNLAYAKSLEQIANNPEDFYHGKLADDIVAAVNKHTDHPLFTASDLAQYKVILHEPVCSKYRGKYNICSVPPSSSGGVAVEELMNIYAAAYKVPAKYNLDWLYYFLEASKLAYADRNQYLADPAFVTQPINGLLAPGYIQERSKLITNKALTTPVMAGTPDGDESIYLPDASPKPHGTTSMSIVDQWGNAVSMTVTVEHQFGSHIFVEGFFLNNELTDFSFAPSLDGHPVANRVEPGKRPRSSIAPTFVFDNEGKLKIIAGSPGGSQIICYVAKSLVAMLDWHMSVSEASAFPDICAVNSTPVIEQGFATTIPADFFAKYGESVVVSELVSGETNIERGPNGWYGAADPRREGVALGH